MSGVMGTGCREDALSEIHSLAGKKEENAIIYIL